MHRLRSSAASQRSALPLPDAARPTECFPAVHPLQTRAVSSDPKMQCPPWRAVPQFPGWRAAQRAPAPHSRKRACQGYGARPPRASASLTWHIRQTHPRHNVFPSHARPGSMPSADRSLQMPGSPPVPSPKGSALPAGRFGKMPSFRSGQGALAAGSFSDWNSHKKRSHRCCAVPPAAGSPAVHGSGGTSAAPDLSSASTCLWISRTSAGTTDAASASPVCSFSV